MKYFILNRYTDWQVMYTPSFMEKSKEDRGQVIDKLMNNLSMEEAPIIPCILIHKHENYRNILNWEEEGMEEPTLTPPILKDIIEISGMLSLGGKRHGGIAISQKIRNALENHIIDKHFFYKFQLEYKGEFHYYYFLLPDTQAPYNHIDFIRTEFLTKPKYNRDRKTMKKELIQPSEVIKVGDLEGYLEVIQSINLGVYNNKILYVNKQFDFFLNEGGYFISERFKNYLEKQGLQVTISELSPASNVNTIIAPTPL